MIIIIIRAFEPDGKKEVLKLMVWWVIIIIIIIPETGTNKFIHMWVDDGWKRSKIQ
jgi:hypothetical protein